MSHRNCNIVEATAYERQERNSLEPTPVADLRFVLQPMQNVLIIRVCAVGDFVMNLPALIALTRVHPGVRFTLVGNPTILELARDFVPVENISSIETQPWCRLFYEPIPDLEFDSAIVWMKDSTAATNARL